MIHVYQGQEITYMKPKKTLLSFISGLFKRPSKHSKNYYYYYLSRFKDYDEKEIYSYVNLLEDLPQKEVKKTSTNIDLLKGKNNQSITIKDIKNYYGKPSYVIRNKQAPFDVTVYVYRIYLGNYRTRFKLHFNKGKLALYNYSFSSLKKEDKDKIIKTISKKYLNLEELDVKNEYVLDAKNTMITFSERAGFSINYILNTPFFSEVNELLEEEKLIAQKLQEKRDKELYRKL